MKLNLAVVFLPALLAGWTQLTFEPCAAADSLSIVYNVNQSQTVAVGLTTFAVVTFSGSVINNTDAPIAFQLTGGPVPFEPFVASFQNGIGFPAITLAPHASTGTINLAVVTLQLFDPDLSYPGSVKIVLQAVSPGTGNAFAENDASIEVLGPVTAAAEPALPSLLGGALLVAMIVRSSKNGVLGLLESTTPSRKERQ